MSTEESSATASATYVQNELAKIESRVNKMLYRRFGRQSAEDARILELIHQLEGSLNVDKFAELIDTVSQRADLQVVRFDLISVVLYYCSAAEVESRVMPHMFVDNTVCDNVEVLTSYLRCLIILYSLVRNNEDENKAISAIMANNEEIVYNNLVHLFQFEDIAGLSYQCLKYSCVHLQDFPAMWQCRLQRFLDELKYAISIKIPKASASSLMFDADEQENKPSREESSEPNEETTPKPKIASKSDDKSPQPSVLNTFVKSQHYGQRVIHILDCLYEFLPVAAQRPETQQWVVKRAMPTIIRGLEIICNIQVPLPLYIRVSAIAVSTAASLPPLHEDMRTRTYEQLIDLIVSGTSYRRKIAGLQPFIHHTLLNPAEISKSIQYVQVLTEYLKSNTPVPRSELLREQHRSQESLKKHLPQSSDTALLSLTKTSYRKRLPAFMTKIAASSMETALAVFFNVPVAHEYEELEWLKLLYLDQCLEWFFVVSGAMINSPHTATRGHAEACFELGFKLLSLGMGSEIQDQIVWSTICLSTLCGNLPQFIRQWRAERQQDYIPLICRLLQTNEQLFQDPDVQSAIEWITEDVDFDYLLRLATVENRQEQYDAFCRTESEEGVTISAKFLTQERARLIVPHFIASLPADLLTFRNPNIQVVQALLQWIDQKSFDNGTKYHQLIKRLLSSFGVLENDVAFSLSSEDQVQLASVIGACLKHDHPDEIKQEQAAALIQLYALLIAGNSPAINTLIESSIATLCERTESPAVTADTVSVLLRVARDSNVSSVSPLALLEAYCRSQPLNIQTSLTYAVQCLLEIIEREKGENSSVQALKAMNVAWQIAENVLKSSSRDMSGEFVVPTSTPGATPNTGSPKSVDESVFKSAPLSMVADETSVLLPPYCPVELWKMNCRLTATPARGSDIIEIVLKGLVSICKSSDSLSVCLSGLKTFLSLLARVGTSHSCDKAYTELLKHYQKGLIKSIDDETSSNESEISAEELFTYAIENCPLGSVAVGICSELFDYISRKFYNDEEAPLSDTRLTKLSHLLSQNILWLAKFSYDDGLDLLGRISYCISHLGECRRRDATPEQTDRAVVGAFCDCLVHMFSHQECTNQKIEVLVLYLSSLFLFRLDASRRISETYDLPLEELRLRFDRALPYVAMLVEPLHDPVDGLLDESLPYRDLLFSNKYKDFEDDYAGFYQLDHIKFAEGSIIGTLLSFIAAPRWQEGSRALDASFTSVCNDWICRSRSWSSPLDLAIYHAVVGTRFRKHTNLCTSIANANGDVDPARNSYVRISLISELLSGPPRYVEYYAVISQVLALRNMLLAAKSRADVRLEVQSFVATEVQKRLSNNPRQPWYRILTVYLMPSLLAEAESVPLARETVSSSLITQVLVFGPIGALIETLRGDLWKCGWL